IFNGTLNFSQYCQQNTILPNTNGFLYDKRDLNPKVQSISNYNLPNCKRAYTFNAYDNLDNLNKYYGEINWINSSESIFFRKKSTPYFNRETGGQIYLFPNNIRIYNSYISNEEFISYESNCGRSIKVDYKLNKEDLLCNDTLIITELLQDDCGNSKVSNYSYTPISSNEYYYTFVTDLRFEYMLIYLDPIDPFTTSIRIRLYKQDSSKQINLILNKITNNSLLVRWFYFLKSIPIDIIYECSLYFRNDYSSIQNKIMCTNNTIIIKDIVNEGLYYITVKSSIANQNSNNKKEETFAFFKDMTPPDLRKNIITYIVRPNDKKRRDISTINTCVDCISIPVNNNVTLTTFCYDNTKNYVSYRELKLDNCVCCGFGYDLTFVNNDTKVYNKTINEFKIVKISPLGSKFDEYLLNLGYFEPGIYDLNIYASDLFSLRSNFISFRVQIAKMAKVAYENVTLDQKDLIETCSSCSLKCRTSTNKYVPTIVEQDVKTTLKLINYTFLNNCMIRRDFYLSDVLGRSQIVSQFIRVNNLIEPQFKLPKNFYIECDEYNNYHVNYTNWQKYVEAQFCGVDLKFSLEDFNQNNLSSTLCGLSLIRVFKLTDNCNNEYRFEQNIYMIGQVDPIYPKMDSYVDQLSINLNWPYLFSTIDIYKVFLWSEFDENLPIEPTIITYSRSYFSDFYKLKPGTKYFWRVVFKTMHSVEIEGPIWSFKTQNSAKLNIIDIEASKYTMYEQENFDVKFKIKNVGSTLEMIDLKIIIHLFDRIRRAYYSKEINEKIVLLDSNSTYPLSSKFSINLDGYYTFGLIVSVTNTGLIKSQNEVNKLDWILILSRPVYFLEPLFLKLPSSIKSESKLNFTYRVRNFESLQFNSTWFDSVYLSIKNQILSSKIIYQAHRLINTNDYVDVNGSIEIPRVAGEHEITLITQDIGNFNLNNVQVARRKINYLINIEKGDNYYCLFEFNNVTLLNPTIKLYERLNVKYNIVNTGNRSQCRYEYDKVEIYDSNNRLIESKLVYIPFNLKVDFTIYIDEKYSSENYSINIIGDHLNQVIDPENENPKFKALLNFQLIHNKPIDIILLLFNQNINVEIISQINNQDFLIRFTDIFYQLIDLSKSLQFTKGFLSIKLSSDKNSQNFLNIKMNTEFYNLNSNYSLVSLSQYSINKQAFNQNLTLTLEFESNNLNDTNTENNRVSKHVFIKYTEPTVIFNILQMKINQQNNQIDENKLICKLNFSISYSIQMEIKNLKFDRSQEWSWYDSIKIFSIKSYETNFENSIYEIESRNKTNLKNFSYNNEIVARIKNNFQGNFTIRIVAGLRFNYNFMKESSVFEKTIQIVPFTFLPDLSITNTNVEQEQINSFYDNIFKVTWTVQNVGYYFDKTSWYDTVIFIDENNNQIQSFTYEISMSLDSKIQYTNSKRFYFENESTAKRIRKIMIKIDSKNNIEELDESTSSNQIEIDARNSSNPIDTTESYLMSNKILNDFSSTYDYEEQMNIVYETLIVSKKLEYDVQYWYDGFYLLNYSNALISREIILNGIKIADQIQIRSFYYNQKFITNITIGVPFAITGQTGYVYLVNDINRRIVPIVDNDRFYSNLFILMSNKTISVNRVKLADFYVHSSSDMPIRTQFSYLIELYSKNKSILTYDLRLANFLYTNNIDVNQTIYLSELVPINVQLKPLELNYTIRIEVNRNITVVEKSYDNNCVEIENFYLDTRQLMDFNLLDIRLLDNNGIIQTNLEQDFLNFQIDTHVDFSVVFNLLNTTFNNKYTPLCIEIFLLKSKSFENTNELIPVKSLNDCKIWENLTTTGFFSETKRLLIPDETRFGDYYLGVVVNSRKYNDYNLANNRLIFEQKISYNIHIQIDMNKTQNISINRPLNYLRFNYSSNSSSQNLVFYMNSHGFQATKYKLFMKVSYEQVPTRSKFDYSVDHFVFDEKSEIFGKLVVSNAKNGLYYLLIEPENDLYLGSYYVSISVDIVQLQITDVFPDRLNLE
ncbi:unnamed protein product, partial [Brachionus calyciflorus]